MLGVGSPDTTQQLPTFKPFASPFLTSIYTCIIINFMYSHDMAPFIYTKKDVASLAEGSHWRLLLFLEPVTNALTYYLLI